MNLSTAVWLVMSFFKALPPEIEEAALVDGCHPMSAFWRVTPPLSALHCSRPHARLGQMSAGAEARQARSVTFGYDPAA